jgi:hypothetical protein
MIFFNIFNTEFNFFVFGNLGDFNGFYGNDYKVKLNIKN